MYIETYPVSADPVVTFSPTACLSYAEIMLRARQLAEVMQQQNLHERFVMLFSDPRENLIATYAALISQRIGIQHAPLRSLAEGTRLEALMQNAGIEAVLSASEGLQALSTHAQSVCRNRRILTASPLGVSRS